MPSVRFRTDRRPGVTQNGLLPLLVSLGGHHRVQVMSTDGNTTADSGEYWLSLRLHTIDSAHLKSTDTLLGCAVVTLDRAACVTFWNDIAERLFGYPAKLAIGKLFYHFLDLDSLVPGSVEWELSSAFYRGTSVRNWRFMHSNGSRFVAEAEIKPLWDGEFLGYKISLQPHRSADWELADI